MLVPAVVFKEEIEKYSDLMRYSKEMMFYTGCQEHGRIYINTEPDEGNYQWAILDQKGNLVGYIAYRIDYFSSCVYSFGLISFKNNPRAMAVGIKQAIGHILEMHPHRIEFRCVMDNLAAIGYEKIINHIQEKYGYTCRRLSLFNVFKDRINHYHGCYIYELINGEIKNERPQQDR